MSNNDPFQITEVLDEVERDIDGVRSVSVSITVNAKPLGADAFIKMEETFAFARPTGDADAIIRRDLMLEILRDQVIMAAVSTADELRSRIADVPRGNVSVAPASTSVPAQGTRFGSQAPAAGPAATVAVANGAAPATNGGWMSVPSRFGDGEIRFLPTSAFPTAQMEAEVGAWLSGKGLNPDAFKVWDNRPGAKGLEAGVPNGCVATVKVSKDAQSFVSAEAASMAVARVKFNANGTLYIWFTKEAEGALRFGALDGVKS